MEENEPEGDGDDDKVEEATDALDFSSRNCALHSRYD